MKNKSIILFLLLIILAGCRTNNKKANPSVFRCNEFTEVKSLDPAFAGEITANRITNQVYNGLIQIDEKLNILPCIAKSWDISDDGLTYTFHLRNDVYFHDHRIFNDGKGRKVTAEDFAYSFSRITNPATASPGQWIFANVKQNDDRSYCFESPNDSTFRIILKHAFAPFLSMLSMPFCFVVPKEIAEYYKKDFGQNPVGTGPFRVKQWKLNEALFLEKNSNYFEKQGEDRLPYLDGVMITFARDNESVLMEFLKGNYDFISGNPKYKSALLDDNGELKKDYKDRFIVYSKPNLRTIFFAFNIDAKTKPNKNSPLLKKEVRQAINYSIDRDRIVKYLRQGIGAPAVKGIVPENILTYKSDLIKGYVYNPAKAKELLAKAGYPEGKGMPEITVTASSYFKDICEYMQHQLGETGIKVKIDINTDAIILDWMANSRINFFPMAWIADYPDAESFLSLFYSKNFAPRGPNFFHFSDKKFDEIYEKALSEKNPETRLSYYAEMENIITEEAPVVLLYYDRLMIYTPKNISGMNANPMNIYSLKKVKKL